MHFTQERDFSRVVPYLKKTREQAVCCRAHPETPNVFRYEGDYWTLAFAGEVRRVRHTLGMQYLASSCAIHSGSFLSSC